jgi:cysteine-rich repeat protein
MFDGKPGHQKTRRIRMKKDYKKSSLISMIFGLALTMFIVNCTPLPEVAECGNGTVVEGEACDDGNIVDGDGCSSVCAVEVATTTPTPSTDITCNDIATPLTGSQTVNVNVPAGARCALSGIVKMKSGTTLTVGAGATVIADSAATPTTVLIIDPGAKLTAVGTAAAPIVFTSSGTVGTKAPGNWGGIIVRGKATVNTGATEGSYTSEADDLGTAGGTDDADNSGSIVYTRIEFGGKQMSSLKEYNGLTLEAVGNGTKIDYVHAHQTADDGFEMFGGTVNLSHVISTNNGDDMLDWTFGYRGKIQYAVLALYGGNSNSAYNDSNFIEADNSETNELNTPTSNPTIYNMTALSDYSGQYKQMFRLRRGTGATIKNAYVANACMIPSVESAQSVHAITGGLGAVAGEGLSTASTLAAGTLVINNSLFEKVAKYTAQVAATCVAGTNATAVAAQAAPITSLSVSYKDSVTPTAGSYTKPAGAGLAEFTGNANTVNAALGQGIQSTDYDFAPTAAITANAATPPTDGFFDVTGNFIGAVGATDWTTWTSFPAN